MYINCSFALMGFRRFVFQLQLITLSLRKYRSPGLGHCVINRLLKRVNTSLNPRTVTHNVEIETSFTHNFQTASNVHTSINWRNRFKFVTFLYLLSLFSNGYQVTPLWRWKMTVHWYVNVALFLFARGFLGGVHDLITSIKITPFNLNIFTR